MSIKNVNATQQFHESNLIIGVRLLDSAVAVLQGVDFEKVDNTDRVDITSITSELTVHNLLTELSYLNETYAHLVTGDPE